MKNLTPRRMDLPSAIKRMGKTARVAAQTGVKLASGERFGPVMLRQTFESMGATYIKLGQLIASSPSLFPEAYVTEFQQCLDQTTPVSFEYIEQILTQELGDITQHFSFVDPKPLASASIAQVHVAKLLSGEEVVIKVQKPFIETVINTDLGVLELGVRAAEKIVPKMKHASLSGVVNEIRRAMILEADFTQEARNITEFQQFLNDTHNTRVVVPRVYFEHSTRRVLTMTRFYGVAMTDPAKMRAFTDDPAGVLSITLNTWFESLMQSASFHADLHAGNLMLLNDGRIGFIDFGIVGRIAPQKIQSAISLFESINQMDYQQMALSMLGMGMTTQKVNTDQLASDLRVVFESLIQGNPVGASMDDDLSQILVHVTKAGERHGIQFPRDFALLLKQLLYFDRFMREIMPDGEMLKAMGLEDF